MLSKRRYEEGEGTAAERAAYAHAAACPDCRAAGRPDCPEGLRLEREAGRQAGEAPPRPARVGRP